MAVAECRTCDGNPANLILNGGIESPGFVWILKGPPSASRLGNGNLMKFFTFDRYPV
jgi:hypothetical protein